MSQATPIHLFEAFGIELEYMLVRSDGLDILPRADSLLESRAGRLVSDTEGIDGIAWSNEIVLHVLEFKTDGPADHLTGLAGKFQRNVNEANRLLDGLGGRLMPGAAHPWMDPHAETRLWPHDFSPIYQAYDRIFGCRGHGWSNLQSVHINLPFQGDSEFSRLHAAIRVLLPLMPALTASSPLLDSRPTGWLDSRMEVYRHNSERLPAVAGQIVPEPAFSQADYERLIYAPMLAQIAPDDPEGILEKEFLNSRGAIARFDRGSIEIRVLDIQECPRADLATAALIISALKALAGGEWVSPEDQRRWAVAPLARIFLDVIRDSQSARIDNPEYLALFGLNGARPVSAGELWAHIASVCLKGFEWDPAWREPLDVIFEQGSLARRILAALRGDYRRECLAETFRRLCDCLERDELLRA